MEYIEQVKTGCSRRDMGKRGRGVRRYEWYADYKTVFHDCLPGREWLEAHYQDVIPEPAIDILIDGTLKASINGNYKRGMIKGLLQPYTTKIRVGRKICIAAFGEADRRV